MRKCSGPRCEPGVGPSPLLPGLAGTRLAGGGVIGASTSPVKTGPSWKGRIGTELPTGGEALLAAGTAPPTGGEAPLAAGRVSSTVTHSEVPGVGADRDGGGVSASGSPIGQASGGASPVLPGSLS